MENNISKITDCRCTTDASGLELVKHGTRSFPIGFYSKARHSTEVPWHWHDHLELEYVEDGEARITIESETFSVRKGEGFFVNSARLHAVFPNEDTEGVFHVLSEDKKEIKGMVATSDPRMVCDNVTFDRGEAELHYVFHSKGLMTGRLVAEKGSCFGKKVDTGIRERCGR